MDPQIIFAVSCAAVIVALLLAMVSYSAGYAHGKASGEVDGLEHADKAARAAMDAELRRVIEAMGRQVSEVFQQHKDAIP